MREEKNKAEQSRAELSCGCHLAAGSWQLAAGNPPPLCRSDGEEAEGEGEGNARWRVLTTDLTPSPIPAQLHYTEMYCAELYSTVLYCTVLNCTARSTVNHSNHQL